MTSMGKILNKDFSAIYTEIRRCLAVDFCHEFEPESPTEPEKALKEMTSEEYQDCILYSGTSIEGTPSGPRSVSPV